MEIQYSVITLANQQMFHENHLKIPCLLCFYSSIAKQNGEKIPIRDEVRTYFHDYHHEIHS